MSENLISQIESIYADQKKIETLILNKYQQERGKLVEQIAQYKKNRVKLIDNFLSNLEHFLVEILDNIKNSHTKYSSTEISDLKNKCSKLVKILNIFDEKKFDKKSQILNKNSTLKVLNLRKKIERARRILILLESKILENKNSIKKFLKKQILKIENKLPIILQKNENSIQDAEEIKYQQNLELNAISKQIFDIAQYPKDVLDIIDPTKLSFDKENRANVFKVHGKIICEYHFTGQDVFSITFFIYEINGSFKKIQKFAIPKSNKTGFDLQNEFSEEYTITEISKQNEKFIETTKTNYGDLTKIKTTEKNGDIKIEYLDIDFPYIKYIKIVNGKKQITYEYENERTTFQGKNIIKVEKKDEYGDWKVVNN